MTRRFLSSAATVGAAITFALSAAAAAPRALADFSGKWNMNIASPDQARSALLNITQQGDSISGTTESELGTAPVKGVVKGDSIYFGFSVDMGGQLLDISGAAFLKNKDLIEGYLDVAGMGAFPFNAARLP